MDRPSSGAAWPPALRRKLGLPPPSAPVEEKGGDPSIASAANDDDISSDSDCDPQHDATIVTRSAPSSSSTTNHHLSSRQLRQYIRQSYAALASIQRQLHRGEEYYYEETYAHGNVLRGWDGIWIEQHNANNGGGNNAGGGGGDAVEGSSGSSEPTGTNAANNNSSNKNATKLVPIRRMPPDHRWFSSSCGSISAVGDDNCAALDRPSLRDDDDEDGGGSEGGVTNAPSSTEATSPRKTDVGPTGASISERSSAGSSSNTMTKETTVVASHTSSSSPPRRRSGGQTSSAKTTETEEASTTSTAGRDDTKKLACKDELPPPPTPIPSKPQENVHKNSSSPPDISPAANSDALIDPSSSNPPPHDAGLPIDAIAARCNDDCGGTPRPAPPDQRKDVDCAEGRSSVNDTDAAIVKINATDDGPGDNSHMEESEDPVEGDGDGGMEPGSSGGAESKMATTAEDVEARMEIDGGDGESSASSSLSRRPVPTLHTAPPAKRARKDNDGVE